MSNTWFQFKQFKVEQAQCAMKVSTDACIQGAWLAQHALANSLRLLGVLDIGAGTGLLSLMLAQQWSDAQFLAIEIDEQASVQAKANFQASPWGSSMEVVNTSIQDFQAENSFGVIVSNPPFFSNRLRANEAQRNAARHDDAMSKKDLALAVQRNLHAEGIFCVMYPQEEWQAWVEEAEQAGLALIAELCIYPTVQKSVNRRIGLWVFQENKKPLVSQNMVIRDASGAWSEDMQSLLRDYYLLF